LQPFVLSLKDLKTGTNEFHWHVDGEFFATFGNPDIQDADLEAEVEVLYEGWNIEVKVQVEGTVTVLCDRCLGELKLPVSLSFETDEVETLSQDFYDEVCLSLPMSKVHEDGGCDEETVRYLSK